MYMYNLMPVFIDIYIDLKYPKQFYTRSLSIILERVFIKYEYNINDLKIGLFFVC